MTWQEGVFWGCMAVLVIGLGLLFWFTRSPPRHSQSYHSSASSWRDSGDDDYRRMSPIKATKEIIVQDEQKPTLPVWEPSPKRNNEQISFDGEYIFIEVRNGVYIVNKMDFLHLQSYADTDQGMVTKVGTVPEGTRLREGEVIRIFERATIPTWVEVS